LFPDATAAYGDNLRLSQIEYGLQHIYLRSWPRCLGLVLSNACNIDCVHCYQAKNGDSLLKPAGMARELRREFIALYPYLSTLRMQGGEVFFLPGFGELLDDVAATVERPIVSISTNGLLISEEWAERMVRMPFQSVTVSIDGGTPGTYARLRQGGNLDAVLTNIRRINHWKEKLASHLPCLDSFFVVMRSNFREIPQYLELMERHGIADVAFQTMEINPENTGRWPNLARDEGIFEPAEVPELHALLQEALSRYRGRFRMIRVSGLRSLFEAHGLDGAFLEEDAYGLYPESDELHDGQPSFELCPNPWTTLFVAENGDVHLCFLSEPVGNLYEMPLAEIWNSPRALAKRSDMIAGRYAKSGCSTRYCSWREGKQPAPPEAGKARSLLVEMKNLTGGNAALPEAETPSGLTAVRRMLGSRERRIAELEAMFVQLCDTNDSMHTEGQRYINHLEAQIRDVVRGYERLDAELEAYRQSRLMNAAARLRTAWRSLRGI
jgi:MoaA/NifB/PqqE/SkfB family radical SAM enzyme